MPVSPVGHLGQEQDVDLSIIIVSWNAKAFLQQCIQSIFKNTHAYSFDIWVIDNGSVDGSPDMIRKEFSGVRLIHHDSNLGFAKANNIGIRESQGRYVCLINSDVKVLNNCLELLVAHMERHPRIGLMAPRILNPDMTLQISCYGFPNLWNSFCYAVGFDQMFPRSRWFGGMYRRYWPYERVRPVDAVSGCFCMARREAINQAGGLDENFFMYMEDFDWCKRLRQAGWEVVFFPEAQAIHYGGGSSSSTSDKYWIERSRSMLHYWHKHHGIFGKSYILLMMLFRHLLRIAQGAFWYLFRASERMKFSSKIKDSWASLRWLLKLRRSK